MTQQQQGNTSPMNDGEVPWWIWLCRWLWKFTAFLGNGVVLSLLLGVASTWLGVSKGRVPADSPFGTLLAQWPIVLPIGCCLLLISLLTWILSRWPLQPMVTSSLVQQDRVRMIGQLRRSYNALLAQTLQGIMWMDVALSEKPDAVRNAATLLLRVNQMEHLLPIGTTILDAYDQAEQNLLILGAPGSGKSTLLLELALQLVERAAQDTTQPFPVILPLSSWAVKHLPLHDWITEQLTQIYNIPRRIGEKWVREDAILPLLDGLDEMNEAARPACINAINTYHQTHLNVPLVICSRTADYDTAAQRQQLVLQCAVIAQPLTPQQVDATLLQAGKPVLALRRAIKNNLALQELATTPLMLSVLMLTYRGTTMRELSSKGALLQQQVWTDYIARMVLWKGDKTHYPLEQTRRWLTWLAQQMRVHQQTIFYAEYLQPDWLTNNQQRIVMWLTVRVPALVLGALASILIFILIPESVPPVFLLQIGLIGGFVGDCLSRNANTETTVAESHLSLSKRVHMMSCILLSILIAASFGLYPDSHYKMVNWVHNGSILGFGSGLSAWAFQMLLFRTHSQHTSVLCTYPSLRRHRFAWFNTIVPQRIWQAAIVLGAGIGLSEGLSYGNSNFSYELSVKISTGLSTGLGVGLTIVLVSVILNTSLRQLRFAERIHWTPQNLSQPKHLRTNLIVIGMVFLFCGLGFGLSEGLCFGLDVGLSHGLGYGLSYGFSYGLLLGLYQSMVQEHIEDQDRHQFNQGIRRSLYNGVLVSLVSAPIIVSMQVLSEVLSAALGYWLSYGPNAKLSTGLGIGWIYWLYYGHDFVWHMAIGGFFLMWAMSGGLTILRHYVIRWLLACSHRFPWRAQTFLDDVTARILLQRVGGGYRFMHRLLLDYFANLETTPSSAISPTTPLIQQIPPP